MPDDHEEHVRFHNDYLYLFFDKPMKGIKMDLGCPSPGSIITNIDYKEEEEEEQEPLTIEFSL